MSNIRAFAISHEEGTRQAPGSEQGPSKAVADSIRVELQRLRALERELGEEEGGGGPNTATSKGTAADLRTVGPSVLIGDAFPSARGVVEAGSPYRQQYGSQQLPTSRAAAMAGSHPQPVHPSVGGGNHYVADLAATGVVKHVNGGGLRNANNSNSANPKGAAEVQPSVKYLAHYRSGGGTSPTVGSLEGDLTGAAGGADGGPFSQIQPFEDASGDVESGISDVRSSILELRAKKEKAKLLGMLQEKVRVGRTMDDDAEEARLRDGQIMSQVGAVVSAFATSPNRHPLAHPQLGGSHEVTLAAVVSNNNSNTAANRSHADGDSTNNNGIISHTNQHGLFVQFNTDRLAAAERVAATAARHEIDQIPFVHSRIGKEYAAREERVFSAHIAAVHDAEVKHREQHIANSTALMVTGEAVSPTGAPLMVTNGNNDETNTSTTSRPPTAGALTHYKQSSQHAIISSFVVSDTIPNTLPRSCHDAVVAMAYHNVLAEAERGKPTVRLDDLPEDPNILVQLTSVVPIAGTTAFTLPFTIGAPLRVLLNDVLALAKMPTNVDHVEGEGHSRAASAAWPQSATYRRAAANAPASAVFRGKAPAAGGSSSTLTDLPRGQRPLNRPNSFLAPTADGGITLHVAGADAPLDLDRSFLQLGYRFPPLIAVRGFRLEYYLATAGSDRRIACVWRPHMTLTDLAKDIAKKLGPKDFRLVRASIRIPEGHGGYGTRQEEEDVVNGAIYGSVTNAAKAPSNTTANYTRRILPIHKSIRYQTPDLVEGNPYLYELGLGCGDDHPEATCAVQFGRTVLGRWYTVTMSQVSTRMPIREFCERAAVECERLLAAEKDQLATQQRGAAEHGRAFTTDGQTVFTHNSIDPTSPYGHNNTQFDDVDEEVSPDGVYRIFRHPIIDAETGVPTFSYNPTKAFTEEHTFPYFITTEEDYTIRHASDCGLLPGTDVVVEFYDSYRKLWSGDVLTAGAAVFEAPISKDDDEGSGTAARKAGGSSSGGGVPVPIVAASSRNIVSSRTERTVPQTPLTTSMSAGVSRAQSGKPPLMIAPSSAATATAQQHRAASANTSSYIREDKSGGLDATAAFATGGGGNTIIPANTPTYTPNIDKAFYPLEPEEASHDRIAYRTVPAGRFDLLTITCDRGQRLRMFACSQTTIDQILLFVWAQTGDAPHEVYLWMDHGKQLTQMHDAIIDVGLMPSGTVHARRRPRVWLGEVLAAPRIDRSLSFTSLPDADLKLHIGVGVGDPIKY